MKLFFIIKICYHIFLFRCSFFSNKFYSFKEECLDFFKNHLFQMNIKALNAIFWLKI